MDKTVGAYAILACQKAMDDAGVTPDQIDGLVCFPSTIAGPAGGASSNWAPRPYFAPPYDSETVHKPYIITSEAVCHGLFVFFATEGTENTEVQEECRVR